MKTRKDIIDLCMEFPFAYEDYPFGDDSWTVMRRRDSGHGFAFVFDRGGFVWVNVKLEPQWGDFMRAQYASVVPAYHMNKVHWNSIVLDGTVPDDEIRQMIADSYELCGRK